MKMIFDEYKYQFSLKNYFVIEFTKFYVLYLIYLKECLYLSDVTTHSTSLLFALISFWHSVLIIMWVFLLSTVQNFTEEKETFSLSLVREYWLGAD